MSETLTKAQRRCLQWHAHAQGERPRRAMGGEHPPDGWSVTCWGRLADGWLWKSEDYRALEAMSLIETRGWTWKNCLSRVTDVGWKVLSGDGDSA